MYVVTFYSFKGGVGRTMALVNAAVELARKRHRVLIVDFDLEAPGISTYDQFAAANEASGIVDYVVSYRETGEAPSVMGYIVPCSMGDGSQSFSPIFVMPAGKSGRGYSGKLHSIDWQRLYAEHEGYLMFEDMKQQWKQIGKFDYVLIDSRTGHTDVGGICTRQLPDAVVLMFSPNKQNISGLEVVVDQIRQQREKKTKLLFCPSNVPEGDDEDDIRRRQLAYASQVLGYDEPATVITHYSSLDLMDQVIFVSERGKTRLAEQYRDLVRMIVKGNLEDKEGASAAIDDILTQLRDRGRRALPRNMELLSDINKIQDHHPKDGKIAYGLAAIYRFLGDLSSEHSALTIAIDQQYEVLGARLWRARNLTNQQRHSDAREDLQAVLNSEEAGQSEIVATIEPLRRVASSNWVDFIAASPALAGLTAEELTPVADKLTVDQKGSQLAANLLRKQWEKRERDTEDEMSDNIFVLSLVGAGYFAEAKKVLTSAYGERNVITWSEVPDIFNFAMADWGEKHKPPLDLLRRILTVDAEKGPRRGANYQQCLALIHAVLGNTKACDESVHRAREALGPGFVFSCWHYLKVNRGEMLKSLQSIERAVRTRKVSPAFLNRRPEAFH